MFMSQDQIEHQSEERSFNESSIIKKTSTLASANSVSETEEEFDPDMMKKQESTDEEFGNINEKTFKMRGIIRAHLMAVTSIKVIRHGQCLSFATSSDDMRVKIFSV